MDRVEQRRPGDVFDNPVIARSVTPNISNISRGRHAAPSPQINGPIISSVGQSHRRLFAVSAAAAND